MAGGPEFNCQKDISGGAATLTLSGVINERTALGSVFEDLECDELIINLKGITRINSCGVRDWVNATKPLSAKFKIKYTECSAAIVDQLNMIVNFLSAGDIVSFYAPYCCEACEKEFDILLNISEHFADPEDREEPAAPEIACPDCGKPMCFNEDEERYLSFISD